jgi:predicted nucleic acid-binding protein
MSERLVLDGSAALALLRHEPGAARVVAELGADVANRRILVPELFWLEVTNVLRRRYAATAAEVVEAIRELDELELETIALDRPILLLALDRSVEHRLTVYDAAYLAIAELEEAALVTLDASLAAAAGSRARPVREKRSSGIAEAPAPYGSVPSGAMSAWAGYGAYLADLRRRASEESSSPASAQTGSG